MPVEPARIFASSVTTSPAPAATRPTAKALAAPGRDAYEAPTAAASTSSDIRATVSIVASGEADHRIETALQARNAAIAPSAGQAGRGILGRLPTAPSTARPTAVPTASGAHCSATIPPPRNARKRATPSNARGGTAKEAPASERVVALDAATRVRRPAALSLARPGRAS